MLFCTELYLSSMCMTVRLYEKSWPYPHTNHKGHIQSYSIKETTTPISIHLSASEEGIGKVEKIAANLFNSQVVVKQHDRAETEQKKKKQVKHKKI